ncbi:nSTAND1 domain-containing NTPase [Leptolyngbya iicbica]|uniref:Novel STAND NTPase 1 domain-containing protein n=1 Tax=Lyngbya confervoides BDU141951 TaxID=1574623 RepID=A0A8T6QSC3_9CYAN|nr:hypothetical protein [Leptolyngbya sp. LK]
MVMTPQRTNPFPGLRPFELDEEHLFFGREGQSDELINRLHRTRFLGVVGTSGSGKSSLVRAGLLPSLYSGFLPGASSSWRIAVLRPGSAPIHNLAAALNDSEVLGAATTNDEAIIRLALMESTLRRGSLGLVEVAQQARLAADESLLIVVDQFEELFRFKAQAEAAGKSLEAEDEAAAFVKLLLAAVNQRAVPIFVVLTMRSDFLGDCAQFRDLPETLNDSQYLIPRLTREQLRRAIEGPVAVGGATITPRLVNKLLNDTGDNPDQLPILQHALMRTWDYWEDQRTPDAPLDLEHYEAIGGMAQALSRHADQIYEGFTDDQCEGLKTDRSRAIAEVLFKCLTDRGADNREIRRPTQLGEICAVANAELTEVVEVIDAFRGPRRSFLMPPPSVPLHAGSVIDISHESLMRNWQRLKGWVEQEVQSANIYRRLAETASMHEQSQAGYLRDPELTIALNWEAKTQPTQAWADRYATNFEEAMAFLAASADAQEREATERERTRRREINRLRGFLAIFAGLSVLAGSTAVYAFYQQQEAQIQAQIAEERGREAKHQEGVADRRRQEAEWQQQEAERQRREAERLRAEAEVAKEDALEQQQEAETARLAEAEQRQQAQAARRRAEAGEAEAQQQAEIAKQQTAIAIRETQRAEKQALNANIQTGALTVENLMASKLHIPALLSGLELGLLISTIEADLISRIDSPISSSTRLQAVSVLRESYHHKDLERNTFLHPDGLRSVSFAPDGQTIASASFSRVKLWDRSGRELQTLVGHSDRILSVSFAPDGQTLVSASTDGTVKLWDVSSGRELQTLAGHSDWVWSVSFAPDGQTIVSASNDGTVKLWDVSSGRELQTLEGHNDLVLSVSFAPDGQTIASSSDGTVKLWDVSSGRELQTLEGHNDWVRSVSFAPDGQTIASASADGTVKLWDVSSGRELQTLEGHNDLVLSVSFAPDGQTIASSGNGTVKLWDVRSGRELQTLEGHNDWVWSVSFAPDGQTIASASEDNTMKLWDVSSSRELQTLEGHNDWVRSVSFAPDGQTIASASDDGTVKLWSMSGRELQTMAGHSGYVLSVSFAPDGQTIASASEDNTMKLWDVSSGRELQTLEGHNDWVWSVSFAPNGQTLASGSEDGTAKLWDVSSGRELQTLAGHSGYVLSVSFTPDGQTLASASTSGTVKLWDVNSGRELQTLVGHTDWVRSVSFAPNGQILASASDDGTVKLWDVNSGRELQTLVGHTDWVRSVSFAPNGQTLASTSDDGTVKLWDVNSGRELQTLVGHSGYVLSVSFAPDGNTLISSDGDSLGSSNYTGSIILWNLNLDDLIAKSCDWLRDYMTNPTTLPEEKALCAR